MINQLLSRLNTHEGEIIWILGMNECSKTTFIKILPCFLRQYISKVLICGHKLGMDTKAVACMPDKVVNPHNVSQTLAYFADFLVDFALKFRALLSKAILILW